MADRKEDTDGKHWARKDHLEASHTHDPERTVRHGFPRKRLGCMTVLNMPRCESCGAVGWRL